MAAEIQKLKEAGAAALKARDYGGAAEAYTQAIELAPDDPEVYKLYSNRSAVHATAKKYDEALTDALETIKAKPDWAKGYSRQGAALSFLGRHEEAKAAYEKSAELDPGNAATKKAIQDEDDHILAASAPSGGGGGAPNLSNIFDANAMNLLKTHPKTRGYFIQDPNFETFLKVMFSNPNAMSGNMLQDPRIMTCFSVVLETQMGMKMHTGAPGEEDPMGPGGPSAGETNGTSSFSEPMDVSSPPPPPPKEPEPEPEPEAAKEVAESLAEKELGNKAYKARKFEEALTHYMKAEALDPTNMVFLNNIAAVYFEQQKYDECIEQCHKAVEVGRENRAAFANIAKALSRIGNVYKKQDKLEEALKYFNKAISEHRDDATVKKAKELEKLVKEKEKQAYINPELAEVAKQKGTEFFKKGNYPAAIKEYTEGLKRNPNDAKLFSNRAACYTKLLEFPLALSDCEKCIALDPTFVKAYLRKAQALLGLKDTTKAAQAYQKALDLDPSCQEAIEGYRTCMRSEDPEQVRKRAMEDPEVQEIFQDPAMRSIMDQMQSDPTALREHLKNPAIAAKIQKLHQSGLIAFK